jgi:hypothetical protein
MRSGESERLTSLDREVILTRTGAILLAKALKEHVSSSDSERDERLGYKLEAVITGLESCGGDET